MFKNWFNKKENPKWIINLLLIVVLPVFVLSFFLPYLITHFRLFPEVFFDAQTGPIGDTIGGIIGPAFSLIGSILTFFAFYVQYQANEAQRKVYQEQSIVNNDQRLTNEQTRKQISFSLLDGQFEKYIQVLRELRENFLLSDSMKGKFVLNGWFGEFELYKQIVRLSLDQFPILNKEKYFNVIHDIAILFTINPGYNIGDRDFGVTEAVGVEDFDDLLIEIQNNIKNTVLASAPNFNYKRPFPITLRGERNNVELYIPCKLGKAGSQKVLILFKAVDALVGIVNSLDREGFDNSYYKGLIELEFDKPFKNLYLEYLMHYRKVATHEFESIFV